MSVEVHRDLAAELHRRLVRRAGTPPEGGAPVGHEELLDAVLAEEASLLPPDDREEVRRLLRERTVGLGILEPLLQDPAVDEILVNATGPVWVERAGLLEPTGVRFGGEAELLHAVERMLAPVGRRVDRSEPLADARLPDGSRVNVVLPPLAVDGPVVTIRRFRERAFDLDGLVGAGTLDEEVAAGLREDVRRRRSILVSGGTGAGKTTTLAALAGVLPAVERIVTVEDVAELRLAQPHVVRLEARPPAAGGGGAVSIRDLVRNALRMRPDRIVVGEVRGGEALDMVLAMTTGHDGSLSTIHASSPGAALRRLETLCLMADTGLPHRAVARMAAEAIDVVVQQGRGPDGRRRITAVADVEPTADGWRTVQRGRVDVPAPEAWADVGASRPRPSGAPWAPRGDAGRRDPWARRDRTARPAGSCA